MKNNRRIITYLIFACLELIFCSRICGIISIILVWLANASYNKGEFADYNEKMKYAKTTLIIGLFILIICFIFLISYFVFSAMIVKSIMPIHTASVIIQ